MEIRRIAAALERFGARFEQRVFTPRELAFCRGRVPELAARFAAKEAVSNPGRNVQGWSSPAPRNPAPWCWRTRTV